MEAPPPGGLPICLARSLRGSLKAVRRVAGKDVPGRAQDSCVSLLEALARVLNL